ncbi:HoxN/HupN/NixA family nickel/cobalt transporter [Staphylococcus simulans]
MTLLNNKTNHIKDMLPYLLVILLLHVIGAACLWLGAQTYPILFGMGILAYTLGLRHAFDADHIAAIDNTVRKLMQEKKNPTGVGFYFSIGHSSVVFIMALLLGISVSWAQQQMPTFQAIGGVIGTMVSGLFLLLIGVLNLIILVSLIRLFMRLRFERVSNEELDQLLASRGLIQRFVGPYFKLISKSWHVLPLGFLFGLGFDTASEIALLALSSGAAQQSLPFTGIIALPILFAAGMSLLDTLDGVLMKSAYHWAFLKPVRKIYYNITITAISVIAALMIGGVEILQMIGEHFKLHSSFWDYIASLEFNHLGYLLVGVFLLFWLVSVMIWKLNHFEEQQIR